MSIRLNRTLIRVLIDSRVTKNLVSTRAVFTARLKPLKKQQPYLLRLGNRETSIIQYKVLRVPLKIYKHYKKINLDYFRLATYNIILELL